MNIKMIKQLMLNLILVMTIASCGGGDEEASPPPAKVTPPPPAPITTSDLVSTPDFDLIAKADLAVTVPSSPSSSINYFINICTDFTIEDDHVDINYNSCKLRTNLSTKEQAFSLFLSTAETRVVAQIWAIEAGSQPINLFWDIAESGEVWDIAI